MQPRHFRADAVQDCPQRIGDAAGKKILKTGSAYYGDGLGQKQDDAPPRDALRKTHSARTKLPSAPPTMWVTIFIVSSPWVYGGSAR